MSPTDDTDRPALSIVYLTYKRDDTIEYALGALPATVRDNDEVEVVLVDNNADGVDRAAMLDGFARSRYVALPENLGCAGGRNAGFRASSGASVMFVDDDAELTTPDPLALVTELFEADPRRGILASRSIDSETFGIRRHEFPHGDKQLDPDRAFDTYRYVGVCHVMRRSMIDEIGLYDDDFFIYSEEFDVAFKALGAGWQIYYDPRLEVIHRHAETGRVPGSEAARLQFVNRLKIGWKHIPMPHMVGYAAAYAGLHLRDTKRPLSTVGGMVDGIRWASTHRGLRRPLPREARKAVSSVGGTLWR